MRWLNKLVAEVGTKTPSKEMLKAYVEATLAKGQVVPGYGHGVLRKTDPRYTCQVLPWGRFFSVEREGGGFTSAVV